MLKGWKTIVFNIVTALLAALEMAGVISLIPADYTLHYALFLAAANFILRLVTTTPAGKPE